jgi:hypothetical protein
MSWAVKEVASINNILYPQYVLRKRNTGGWTKIYKMMAVRPYIFLNFIQRLKA